MLERKQKLWCWCCDWLHRRLRLMLLTRRAKKKTLFTFIHVGLTILLINGPPPRVRKLRSCKFSGRTRLNNTLPTMLISHKVIRWPYCFNAKNYLTANAECVCKIVKKNTVGRNSSNLEVSICVNLRKIYFSETFSIFSVSPFGCNKRFLQKDKGSPA